MKLWKWYEICGFALVGASSFLLTLLAYAADSDLPVDQFFNQVIELVKSFGGIPWTMKIAGIIMLIIATMKVTFLRPLWDKLGWIKGFVAGILGLIAGVLMLSKENMLSFPGVVAYMFSGMGAVVLHQMLDALKQIPGIGPVYVQIIDFIMNLAKAPQVEKK